MAHEGLTARTDAKIRYAKLHLMELREYDHRGHGHDFERAHQEAFFAQLFGAYAGLFQELNKDLGCELDPESVSLGKMRNTMKDKEPVSEKLSELYNLEQDATMWLSKAKTMRDHISHLGGIPLSFYDDVTSFRHPKTMVELPGDYFDYLENWVIEMEVLIKRMRV